MSSRPKTFLTVEEYLELERKAEYKSEYYQGEMFAMAGASEPHNLLVWNLVRELGQQLRTRPCRAYPSDMRVRVSATGLYTYPDITVVCAEPQFADEHIDTLLNPTFIAEVLSPPPKATIAAASSSTTAPSNRSPSACWWRRTDSTWICTRACRMAAGIVGSEPPGGHAGVAVRWVPARSG